MARRQSPASAQARKKQEVSVTISELRERNKTSQAVFRVGYGPGRGLPLLHAGGRGKTARQRLREESWRRPRRSICRGHAAATPGIAHHAGARTAVLQRQRSARRACHFGYTRT